MTTIQLHETKHPSPAFQAKYDRLVGIDGEKTALLNYLLRVFEPERLSTWLKQHHAKGLPLAERLHDRAPFVILGGEVGCGKTELARAVGTVLANAIDKQVVTVETPSDIRGGGLVGQLSERITAAFNEARVKVGKHRGLLVLDEGDDLGASRAQSQAHHEDRAGLNVLIKEIDRLSRDDAKIAVILITNRVQALDPALIRRAQLIRFNRPDAAARRALFEQMLQEVPHGPTDIDALVDATERQPPFSYSDLVERGAEAAVAAAFAANEPFSASALREALTQLEPSPLIEERPLT
ncbi:MAG: ATP-binding protein [Polyangiaceae bacterium]|nr:ATP-binding protein [Polyangiaceae bacterium]